MSDVDETVCPVEKKAPVQKKPIVRREFGTVLYTELFTNTTTPKIVWTVRKELEPQLRDKPFGRCYKLHDHFINSLKKSDYTTYNKKIIRDELTVRNNTFSKECARVRNPPVPTNNMFCKFKDHCSNKHFKFAHHVSKLIKCSNDKCRCYSFHENDNVMIRLQLR